MESSIWKHAARFLRDQKNHKLRLGVFVCLAAVAVLGTAAVLKYNGIAMTHKEKVLECPYTVHEHTQSCYTMVEGERVLTCGLADYVVHTHNDDCYDGNGTLVCPLPEVEAHKHTEDCYTDEQVLVCTQAESAGHQHSAECYTTERGGLICGMEEHQHGDGCYDETGALICTLPEHVHTEDCYSVNEVLTCTQEEGAGGHVHTAECYETQRVLSCGKLEKHTHDKKACYDEHGNLTCDKIVLEEHVHSDECFQVVELTPEEVAALNSPVFFTPDESDEEVPEEPVGSEEEPVPEDSAVEEGSAVDESGVLEPNLKKVFQSELLTVTAAYYEEANIPEEAELDVQLILDEAQYQARREEAAEWMRAEDTAWLYDIGFFVDGEEIEPEDTVYITMEIHFDALPDRAPVSVVHFAKKGPELLEASELAQTENGSFVTEFEVNEFSEFLLIVGEPSEEPAEPEPEDAEQVSYKLSDSFEFETDEFQLTLHVDGIATAEKSKEDSGDETASEGSALEETPADEPAEITGDDADVQPAEDAEDTQTPAETEEPPAEPQAEPAEEPGAEPTVFTTEDDGQAPGTAEEPETAKEPEPRELTAEDVESELELLAEDDEIYAAFAEAAKTAQDEDADEDGESKLLNLSVMQFKLRYQDAPLDLTDCRLTAEITPKETVLPVEGDVEEDTGYTLVALCETDGQIGEAASVSVPVESENVEFPVMTLSLENDVVAMAGTLDKGPKFKVQYYANLDRLITSQDDPEHRPTAYQTTLSVIDTVGKKLPAAGTKNPPLKDLYLVDGTPYSKKILTQLFEDREYSYFEAWDLSFFNILAENERYALKEIWVLKDEVAAVTSDEELKEKTDSKDWTVYPADAKFTNNQAEANQTDTILIKQDTVIRLVFDAETGSYNNAAGFYDYDITDGYIYTSKNDADAKNNRKNTGSQNNYGTVYVNTGKQGINSPGNYTGSGAMLGFGNANTGSGLQQQKAGVNFINRYNREGAYGSPDVSYRGLSFGIATGLNGDRIQYASGITAPNLFNEGAAAGKTQIDGWSLNFNRSGDTYTLSAVAGTGLVGLERFTDNGSGGWSNNFWPMDYAPTYGVDGHDLKFGNTSKQAARNYCGIASGKFSGASTLPTSDNGQDHNNFFGMQYALTFEYTPDYCGPLEYYFFGDDDMWVFLDYTLVADLGGVHLTAGEHVNLWDYLQDEKDAMQQAGSTETIRHKLSVFYTERGASGSTCYMQFTLPSVSSIPYSRSYGNLRIDKDVDGGNEPDRAFSFNLKVPGAGTNTYPCTIYNEDGTVASGPEMKTVTNYDFQLKDGQYLIVNYLGADLTYTVTETAAEGYLTTVTADGSAESQGLTGSGTIPAQGQGKVIFTNHYQYELPESGGTGTTLFAFGGIAMLAMCLMCGYSMRRRRGRGAN